MYNKSDYLIKSRENISIDINNVLKKTYILLSFTLFFSSLMAYFSIKLNFHGFNFIIELLLMFGIIYLINIFKNNILSLFFVFLFTGFMGFTIGPILNTTLSLNSGNQIVLLSFFSTGFIFTSLSFYVIFTKKNFDFMGSFLFTGFIIILLLFLLSLFINIPLIYLVISGLIAVLSSLSILYQTSQIVNGGEKNYILATVSLYLNIYNIFLSLLNIFGLINKE